MIYLDNNATSRIHPAALAAMSEAWSSGSWNPASQHEAGQATRRHLEAARLDLLGLLGARTRGMAADRLIFTSGGTEANNLAVFGLSRPGLQVLVSAVEHPSVMAAVAKLRVLNIDVRLIPVDSAGVVRLDRLEELLARPTSLVAVMAANSETGVIQPISEVARLAHAAGALVHCDAVQWIGKLPISFLDWDVDSMSLSGHKFHGPVGVGGLCLKASVNPQPQLFGGFQEAGLRPGTVPVPLVLGMAAALSQFSSDISANLLALRERFEQSLLAISPVRINGVGAERLPHTSNIAFPGQDRQALLMAADAQHLCFSAGSACASGSSEPSPVLLAMGLAADLLESSVRFSFSRYNTLEEVDRAVAILARICQQATSGFSQ